MHFFDDEEENETEELPIHGSQFFDEIPSHMFEPPFSLLLPESIDILRNIKLEKQNVRDLEIFIQTIKNVTAMEVFKDLYWLLMQKPSIINEFKQFANRILDDNQMVQTDSDME